MKKITLTFTLLFLSFLAFAQDTEAPTAPTNVQVSDDIFTHEAVVAVQWEHATDNIGVTTYEIFINGILEEIVPYDGSSSTQYFNFGFFNNGTYCITILARDAAGNTSTLSNQSCRYINVIYQVDPYKPYLSGLVNYSGDNKIIEISNLSASEDLSNYSLKISNDGSGNWDTVYTFPANTILSFGETYVIAHPNATICTSEIDEYNASITNFDGNDAIGLFKYDILYDVIGDFGNSSTSINNDIFIKREAMVGPIPNSSFDINDWNTYSNNGNCPSQLGIADLIILNTEDEMITSFQMYPNPIKTNTLQFTAKNNQTIDSVSILDMNGRTVLNSSSIINNQLDIQNIKQGVYFVQIQSDNKTSTHKLIRQ